MALRAIIIDDEQNGIESLKLLIEKFIPDVRVVATTAESPGGIKLITDFHPDIVFLDINMPEMNGFDMLSGLEYHDFALIFTTAHAEYALKALKSNALDYLLKPIDIDDLQSAIEKVRSNKQKKSLPDLGNFYAELGKSSKIALNTKNKVEYIDRNDIVRMESDSNYTHVHTLSGGELVVGRTIRDFEDMLCKAGGVFMRVHQSHIINLNHVVRFKKDNSGIITMRDCKDVPLSKQKREEFLKWLKP